MTIQKAPQPHKSLNFSQILKLSSLPRLETEILIAFLLGKTREFVLTHPETKIDPTLYRRFRILEQKRLINWPIAYLTGHKEFYDLDFKVNPTTLVPRPETEMIVEEIIKAIKASTKSTDDQINDNNKNSKNKTSVINHTPLIIDLGTGSGAIIIAIAHELKRLFPTDYKKINFAAVDISAGALRIAKQNAQTHKLNKKIKFYRGNLLMPLQSTLRNINKQTCSRQASDLIIAANLPYLTPGQIKKSPSIRQEPRLALDGGADGLKYYRELFKQLSLLSAPNRSINNPVRTGTILCEIDPGQAEKIIALSKKYWPKAQNQILPDLCGQKRLLITKIRL